MSSTTDDAGAPDAAEDAVTDVFVVADATIEETPVDTPAVEASVAASAAAKAAVPDPALLDAHDLALAALHEITPAATVGPPAGYRVESMVVGEVGAVHVHVVRS